jgi:uncharacterized membrane protein YfhO
MVAMNNLTFKKSLILFSIALMVLEIIVYREFIFGDYYFLYKDLGGDSYNICYPELFSKIEVLKSGNIPNWNFNVGLGENKYAFWLEPVALFIAFVFFKNNVIASLIWIQLVYTFLAGVFIFCFFKNNKFHCIASSIGAVLYAFSGYMVGCSTWFLTEFSNNAMLFALLLFSLQLFLDNKKQWLFTLVFATIGIAYTPLSIYFSIIIVLIYLTINFQKFYNAKHLVFTISKLTLSGFIGLGISAFMLLNNAYQMLQSPRGSGMFPATGALNNNSFRLLNSNEFSTSILRLFSNNLQGIADDFKGASNYFEAPFWYCGLLVLLLIPQLFHFLNKSEKLVYGSVLSSFILMAMIPKLRFMLWLFTGDYYRFSVLIVVLFLLFFAVKSLHFIITTDKIFKKTLFITLTFLLLILLIQKQKIVLNSSPNIDFIVFMLLVYSLLFLFWNFIKQKKYVFTSLLVLLFIEVISFATPTLMDRKILTKRDEKNGSGYHDFSKNIVSEIKKNDSTFFRIEKDFFSGKANVFSYNEANIQGYFGSSSYYSFHNINYIRFLKSIDALYIEGEPGSRFVKGLREIPEAMQICGIKYFISNRDSLIKDSTKFELINETNGYKIYQLKNNLPLGFTYSNYISEENFNKLKNKEKHALLNKAVVVDNDFKKELHHLKQYNHSDSIEAHNLFKITSFENNTIKGTINTKKSAVLFFSIPYDEGWTVTIDDNPTSKHKVFFGLIGVKITSGNHIIKLTYKPPYLQYGIIISVFSILIFILWISFSIIKKRI